MISTPVNFYSAKKRIPKQYISLPTASLLAYYDAWFTSSISASNQTTWFDLSGNGYHGTITGSITYVTNSLSQISYDSPWRPALIFGGSSRYTVSGSLADAFGTISSGYTSAPLCSGSYLNNTDWTIVIVAKPDSIGTALRIGDDTIYKYEALQRSFPFDLFLRQNYVKTNPTGSTGGHIVASTAANNSLGAWGISINTKECYSVSPSYLPNNKVVQYYKENPYTSTVTSSMTGTYPPGYPIANNALTGSGLTFLGHTYVGDMQAIAIYNKVLTPTEIDNVFNYFIYREL